MKPVTNCPRRDAQGLSGQRRLDTRPVPLAPPQAAYLVIYEDVTVARSK